MNTEQENEFEGNCEPAKDPGNSVPEDWTETMTDEEIAAANERLQKESGGES